MSGMSTCDRMEKSLSSGIGGIKDNMRHMMENIKKKNASAEQMEQEREKEKMRHLKAYNKTLVLRDRVQDMEETLRKKEEKVKDMAKRLLEKEQYLVDVELYRKSLKKVTPDEGKVAEMEERLQKCRDMYRATYQAYQKARRKKVKLEDNVETSENKARDYETKLKSLINELEYSQVEEARRMIEIEKQVAAANNYEEQCTRMELMMKKALVKKEKSIKKAVMLEQKVTKCDNEIDNHFYDRQKIEKTIKELIVTLRRERGLRS